MDSLKILSLGRNLIKKLENLDAVADTLEELWISYNQVASLVSVPWPRSHDACVHPVAAPACQQDRAAGEEDSLWRLHAATHATQRGAGEHTVVARDAAELTPLAGRVRLSLRVRAAERH